MQLKQRRSLKPASWFGVFYAACSLAIALWLYFSHPVLLWIYLGALAALMVDAISVFHRAKIHCQ